MNGPVPGGSSQHVIDGGLVKTEYTANQRTEAALGALGLVTLRLRGQHAEVEQFLKGSSEVELLAMALSDLALDCISDAAPRPLSLALSQMISDVLLAEGPDFATEVVDVLRGAVLSDAIAGSPGA
jgi:hypothetical protein